MRAIVIHDARDLRIEDRSDPGDPGPDQVRIRMAAGGICGSDLHYYNHGGFGTVRLREPMVLGHEVAGHVEAVGPDVEGLAEGQLVAVSPSRPCAACEYCLRGQPNHCLNMRFYGSAMPFPHIQGAFRETLIVEAAQCAPADGLRPGQAAMAEPLAVALHAVRQAGNLVGRSVLVTGCGPIGLLVVLAVRRAGADRVVATDLAEFPLTTARALGADDALDLRADSDAMRPYQTEKGRIDVAFECSGAAPALAGAIAALRPGGTLVQLGLGGDMTVPMQALTAKELTLRGSFRFHEEFHAGVGLMRRGLVDVDPLITHSLPLAEAVEAFDLAGDRTRALKAQLVFGPQ